MREPAGPTAVPAAAPHPFATHIPDRHPRFKTHTGLGHAKNAVIMKMHDGARHGMTIYRLEDGEYRPWLIVEPGQKRDEIPELAPAPAPRSHVRFEIRRLVEREQWHLAKAAEVAAERARLEAML